MSIQNRRKTQRHRTSLNGRLSVRGRRIKVQIENLSRGGARISLDRPLLEGDEVEISFQVLPQISGIGADTIDAFGTVVWISEDMDAGFQAGIRFENMQPNLENVLNSLLESYPPV